MSSHSLNIGDMDQAWINTSEALAKVQAQAGDSIEASSKGQEKVCSSMLKMSRDAMQEATHSYETFEKDEQARQHASFWQSFFQDFVGGLLAVLSFASGQPEMAVMSVALLIGQQVKVGSKSLIGKLESDISPNSAVGRLFIGLTIMVVCAAVGGAGASAREGSVLGGSLLGGSQALGSAGIQSNISDLTSNSKLALGVSCAVMGLALVGGIAGGKLTLGNANFSSLGQRVAKWLESAEVVKLSSSMMAGGQAGQASAGIAVGAFTWQQGDALESASIANALSSFVNDLRDEFSSQVSAFISSMEQVATTAAKEGVAVGKGMAKSAQWAAQLAAHA